MAARVMVRVLVAELDWRMSVMTTPTTTKSTIEPNP